MEMFWDWCLKSPPLCFLRSSYIYFWRWISVWTLWHWNGTEKFPIFLNTSSVALSVVGGPFVSMFLNILLPRNSDRIQKLVAPYILNQTAQTSRGGYFWSFFVKSLGPSCCSKGSLVSSKTCQVMCAHLTRVNLYLAALREGWFNILRHYNT